MKNQSIDGASLTQRIREAGYSLKEFAQELGIGKTAFYYYRVGLRPIPQKLRTRIAELLQCSFEDLCVADVADQKPACLSCHQRDLSDHRCCRTSKRIDPVGSERFMNLS
jgi:hypothetical protein